MDTLTTVVFLLDILELQGDFKKKLHKKQLEKLENLIKVLYQKSNKNINEDEYLALYSIHRSKISSEKTKERKSALLKTLERIRYLLMTGKELESPEEDSTDVVINSLNQAYTFISSSVKEQVNTILSERLKEKDLQKLKCDMSENASLEIVRLYVETGKTKEEFCNKNFITFNRLNRALAFVLNSEEESLIELKIRIYEKEVLREHEIELIEQVMLNYNRREKNINLLEFQSLSSQTINRTLAILKERGSIAYPALNELYKEYQNRLRLQPFSFESMREMKTVINGVPMTDEDHDAIEKFFIENNYPQQRAIYTYVRDAYLKGNLESVRRDNLKRTVLERFGIVEKPKEKIHK